MATNKILILEDDSEVAGVFARALRYDGNDVTVCTRFEDARDLLALRRPDAVLTDIRVGEYNGLHLAHLFRCQSPNGTVVVVTGHDDTVMRQEVEHLNAEFMLKPVAVSDLRRAFKRDDLEMDRVTKASASQTSAAHAERR
jgi:DNA-binding NtrC family response regulator